MSNPLLLFPSSLEEGCPERSGAGWSAPVFHSAANAKRVRIAISWLKSDMPKLFDDELHEAMQQLFDETIEAIQLAKVSPDLDDLSATFAVALLKLGLATGFVEQKYPGFAKEVEGKRQRVIAALTQKH